MFEIGTFATLTLIRGQNTCKKMVASHNNEMTIKHIFDEIIGNVEYEMMEEDSTTSTRNRPSATHFAGDDYVPYRATGQPADKSCKSCRTG